MNQSAASVGAGASKFTGTRTVSVEAGTLTILDELSSADGSLDSNSLRFHLRVSGEPRDVFVREFRSESRVRIRKHFAIGPSPDMAVEVEVG